MKTKTENLRKVLNADSRVTLKKERKGYGIYVNGWYITSAFNMSQLFDKVGIITNAVIASELSNK